MDYARTLYIVYSGARALGFEESMVRIRGVDDEDWRSRELWRGFEGEIVGAAGGWWWIMVDAVGLDGRCGAGVGCK